MQKYIVAITGASGVVYGVRLVQTLLKMGYEIHLIISEAAYLVLEQEMGWQMEKSMEASAKTFFASEHLAIYDNRNIAASIASGSFLTEGMIIIPCSMSTLASVALGMSDNLIERAADVMLKEKRPLTIVPRETPLSSIHLHNMLTLSNLGVTIVPAMPAFYHQPQSIEDMISFVLGKVLDTLKIPNRTFQRYEK